VSAIVTDARYRMSLAVIRSLGRAGVRVIAQEERETPPRAAIGFHSRYTRETLLTSSPSREPDRFVDDLLRAGEPGDVLIPVSLPSIFAVSQRLREVRERFGVALPPPEAVRTADDTKSILEVARRCGVPVPRTATANVGEDPAQLLNIVGLPAVIKYRDGDSLGLPAVERYVIVKDRDSFVTAYRAMAARQDSPLAQEYIAGEGWGVSAVMDAASDPVAVFCHRRIREYPSTGGPSCFCESARDDTLIGYGLKLLKELRWHGVAMVEFRRETSTGRYVLMEVNPRFWGSLPLAIASGVDFPQILYRVARGEPVSPVTDYKLGVRMRYLFQDLLSVPGYLRHRRDRAAFLLAFLRDLLDLRVVDGVFQRDDPIPGLYYLARAPFGAARGH